MKTIRKLSAIMLTLVMILSLAACGKSTSGNSARINGFSAQNVLKDRTDDTAADKANGENAAAEDETAYEGSTKISVAVGSGTKQETASLDNSENGTAQSDPAQSAVTPAVAPSGEYNKGTVLVKVKKAFNKKDFGTLAYTSAEPLYNGSKWYIVKLADAEKTEEAVAYLTNLATFETVDYDYVMSAGTTTGAVDVSCNPDYDKQENHFTHKVPEGWEYARENGKKPGGSSDVVVAVIDTGVDYNHLDLRNNIWVNSAEIPGNGIDDDGNGYIDDVYGWDFVGNDNDPMDDNGHGTHVAGIIAAENNGIGGVGVAYNSKVMVLKAGNSSGYFNNSDIAEAIQYAYMNGASVINMSFGGSFISVTVEEALQNAYNSCVLVAAAGNDGACNNLACRNPGCLIKKVTYPAALPYVIGVMSANHDGSRSSLFSNYDHYPYNSVEYEVYAVGEAVPSCWPGNKYARLSGTSMAAPTVSGIAALLRSYYSDREMYSTKFIQSQIVNTGTRSIDGAHSLANVYDALTRMPKPEVNLYDYSIDDSTAISSANNGNGVIDAGETVRLYISLHNRGGVASNVNVSIDTNRGEGLTDPYFTFVNPTMQLSDIGTYSVRESGDKYFEIVVSKDCPNDYLADFNIRYTYTNGMDSKDTAKYKDDGNQKAQFNVSSGYCLPSVISEDTTFTNDRLYIVGENVTIPAGVTVTFEEGCRIQFYDDREYYNSPTISVYGNLIFEGTKDNMIKIYPSERNSTFVCWINADHSAALSMNYVDAVNLHIYDKSGCSYAGSLWTLKNSYISTNGKYLSGDKRIYQYVSGETSLSEAYLLLSSIENSYINFDIWGSGINCRTMSSNYIVMPTPQFTRIHITNTFTNNILYSQYLGMTSYNNIIEFGDIVTNNLFVSADDEDPKNLTKLKFAKKDKVSNNTFSAGYQKYANQVIEDYIGSNGNPTVDVYGSCSDTSVLYPHISDIKIFNADGEQVTTIGKEKVKVRVTFSKAMDTSVDPGVFFGTVEPYADYKIEGGYVSDTVWEGTYTLKAYIENGIQQLVVKGACAAGDPTKTVHGEYQLYKFNIDTTAAMSMNLFAEPTDRGIELKWNQDDYSTIMGYNIYRADSKDGNYVRINPSVLLSSEDSFVDDNAEPGKTYWYTFTVVLSDFSESAPAGKVSCTAADTLNPTVYHTPVNQGYANNNLVISCTASDNVAVSAVTLYYRTTGTDAWKSLAMSKVNDKYSATIFGSELTLDGIEYYISVSDGVNTVTKGTADDPYKVVIKDASLISRIGDVDGDSQVTTKDALMLMQCLNGDRILSDDAFKRADLNGDGQLSSAEALRILQYVNGKIKTLEM